VLNARMNSIDRNFRDVKNVERNLIKKEGDIERELKQKEERERKEKEEQKKKEEANAHKDGGEWGESSLNGDSHEISMKPLVIHKGPPTGFLDAISRIHDKIR
jgi:hypothetical protein